MADENDIGEVVKAVAELRETVEKSVLDGLDQNKVDAINKFLDDNEELNQKAALETERLKTEAEATQKAHEELEATAKEMGTSIEALELAIAKGAGRALDYKDGDNYKSFQQFCISGVEKMNADQIKTLRTDREIDGGVLVPVEIADELLKEEIEISAMRAISRVRTMSAKTIEVPRRTTVPAATYEGEEEAGADSNSNYVSESLTAFRQTTTVPITMDLLNDSAFNMESEINSDVVLSFAQNSGNFFINGDGVKKPKGFLTDTRITSRETAASGLLDSDTILLTTGDHKVGYNPVWTLNQRTLAIIRTFKSTDGVFLWQPGLNGPVLNTLAGFPYFIMPDMPDVAGSALAMAFGDFRRGYEIADRTGMTMIRDNLAKKRQAIIEFTFHRWNTGQVVVPEAIKLIKIKA